MLQLVWGRLTKEIYAIFPHVAPCWLVICCRPFVRVCCLHLHVVQEDLFDYREDGYVIAQNAVIFISGAVETTVSHRHVCVSGAVYMKYSVYRLCSSLDHSTLIVVWMNSFVPMPYFISFRNIMYGVVFLKSENSGSDMIREMWREELPSVFVLMWNDTSFVLKDSDITAALNIVSILFVSRVEKSCVSK